MITASTNELSVYYELGWDNIALLLSVLDQPKLKLIIIMALGLSQTQTWKVTDK